MKATILLTFLIVASTWTYPQAANPDPIQSMCANAPNPQKCIAIIAADPRTDLKKTPEGAAIILMDDAKKNVKETINFIKSQMNTVQEADVKEQMKGCLQAYQQVGKGMKLKKNQLKNPEDREDVVSNIDTAESDISYDCGWQELQKRTPVANQMADMVAALSDDVNSATSLLSSPSG